MIQAVPELLIESTHMACVKGPAGTFNLVVFNPTDDTVQRVKDWRAADNAVLALSKDRAGDFRAPFPYRILDYVYDYGTLIVHVSRAMD